PPPRAAAVEAAGPRRSARGGPRQAGRRPVADRLHPGRRPAAHPHPVPSRGRPHRGAGRGRHRGEPRGHRLGAGQPRRGPVRGDGEPAGRVRGGGRRPPAGARRGAGRAGARPAPRTRRHHRGRPGRHAVDGGVPGVRGTSVRAGLMNAQTVVPADPVTDPRWRRLAAGPGGSLFTSPPWIEAVCRTYGFTPEARIALDATGEPVGGFAWVAVEDVRGRRLSSLPFSDRADPLVPDAAIFGELLDAAKTGGDQLTVRCLDSSPASAEPRMRAVGEAAWHGTPLDAGIDELHRRLSGTSRRNIAAAERAGVRVEVRDDLDAVRAFHRL